MANGDLFNTLIGGGQSAAIASGNPIAIAAATVIPFLLQQSGLINDDDTSAFRNLTQQQAQTQGILQQNLQAQLQGQPTPASQALMANLQRQQAGQRQATASSLSRGASGAGPGGGRTFRAAQFERQDRAFNEIMTGLLGQFQQGAQQLAAGQSGVTAQSQSGLSNLEQEQLSSFSSGIGRIISDFQQTQDPTLLRIQNLIQQLIGRSPAIGGPIDSAGFPELNPTV